MPSDWQQYLYPSTASSGAGGSGGSGAGAALSLAVGTVQTLPAGASATASVTKQGSGYALNLGIPQGAAGAIGPAGPQGPAGAIDTTNLKPEAIFKEFQQGYVQRPAEMSNNTWIDIKFDKPFSTTPILHIQPDRTAAHWLLVKNVTSTGYSCFSNYSGVIQGWYYTAYVPKD